MNPDASDGDDAINGIHNRLFYCIVKRTIKSSERQKASHLLCELNCSKIALRFPHEFSYACKQIVSAYIYY